MKSYTEMYNLGLYYIKSNNSLFRDDINKDKMKKLKPSNIVL
jgi:hypothetical protein